MNYGKQKNYFYKTWHVRFDGLRSTDFTENSEVSQGSIRSSKFFNIYHREKPMPPVNFPPRQW